MMSTQEQPASSVTMKGVCVTVLGLVVCAALIFVGIMTQTNWVSHPFGAYLDLDIFKTTTGNTNATENPTKVSVDFRAGCDVHRVVSALYDPAVPLTAAEVSALRGCAVLLFFRNPRSASTSIFYLLKKLSKFQGFENVMSTPKEVNGSHWKEYVHQVAAERRSVAVSTHIPAMDLVSKAERPPVLFNLQRNPIDHIVSIYKMQRYGDRAGNNELKKKVRACPMSFDQYIQKYGLSNSCTKDEYMGLRFLCGRCKSCSRTKCLALAKKNLDTVYLVVGLSENIPATLLVMEALLPQFFNNALQEYVHMSGLYQMFSADPSRNTTMSPATRTKLEKLLAPDFELYAYVKARFYVALKKVLEFQVDSNLTSSKSLYHRNLRADKLV